MIHSTAKIHPSAIIDGTVTIEANVTVMAYATVTGDTLIKSGTQIRQNAMVGVLPTDEKYVSGGWLSIGRNCVIGNSSSIEVGAKGSIMGDNCFVMTFCGIPHDHKIGNNVKFSAGSGMAGEVTVGDDVVFGAGSGAHQKTRIGKGSIIAARSFAKKDVLPYSVVDGFNSQLVGANLVGMRRKGIPTNVITKLNKIYKKQLTKESLIEELNGLDHDVFDVVRNFVLADSKRGLCL